MVIRFGISETDSTQIEKVSLFYLREVDGGQQHIARVPERLQLVVESTQRRSVFFVIVTLERERLREAVCDSGAFQVSDTEAQQVEKVSLSYNTPIASWA